MKSVDLLDCATRFAVLHDCVSHNDDNQRCVAPSAMGYPAAIHASIPPLRALALKNPFAWYLAA